MNLTVHLDNNFRKLWLYRLHFHGHVLVGTNWEGINACKTVQLAVIEAKITIEMVKWYPKMRKLLPASKPTYLHIFLTTLFPAVDCGNPGTPPNGRRTGSSTTYNSVVTYTCNTGSTLQGSNRRTCQSNGQWSGSLPRCNRKFCFVLYIVSIYCLCFWIIQIHIYIYIYYTF